MAITKTLDNDKIEVVNHYHVHVRKATILKEDGVELNRSFHRHVISPGYLDASDNLVSTDISGEDADVQAICNAAWTDQVKSDYRALLISQKPSS